MFANSRTESEISRTKWEITSITKIGTAARPSTPGRDPALQVADEALGPDALDVVADQTTSVSTSGTEMFAVAA